MKGKCILFLFIFNVYTVIIIYLYCVLIQKRIDSAVAVEEWSDDGFVANPIVSCHCRSVSEFSSCCSLDYQGVLSRRVLVDSSPRVLR